MIQIISIGKILGCGIKLGGEMSKIFEIELDWDTIKWALRFEDFHFALDMGAILEYMLHTMMGQY